jgi:hypothetical protein
MGIGHEGVRYVLTHFLELGTVCATDDVKSTRTYTCLYYENITNYGSHSKQQL